ncbi:MAG: formamidopyrimidine-DNA glycosylase [Chitinivibrionales bacterium]|nr:formamidopyrimidine-DNA glycosylase [Chitinivibrionales bacterium]
MPEHPDIVVYIEKLEELLSGASLKSIRIASPLLLRTVVPPISDLYARTVAGFARMGKRIVWHFEKDYYLIMHLMVAGRLHWKQAACTIGPRGASAAFDFEHGSLLLTEAGSKKRASLHLVNDLQSLQAFDPGGLEPLQVTLDAFQTRLQSENHTVKRALTDPRLFSGIGNSYSDEILYQAKLSPVKMTQKLRDEEISALYAATREILTEWTDKLRLEVKEKFPEKVTAFRPGMTVHGKFGKACPRCGAAIQRIRYASNETNYCPKCQTGGKLLADRSLSRLLKKDWPRTPEELEEKKRV